MAVAYPQVAEKLENLTTYLPLLTSIMDPKFITGIRVIQILTVLLNIVVYFYPEFLNQSGQCNWHEFEGHQRLQSKYDFINEYLPEYISDKLLVNFPDLKVETERTSPSAYYNDSKVKDINMLAFGDPQINGNWPLTKYIKRLDNYGNDYYLGHIYATMKKRLQPSHAVVMGDLFSSQWILDSEFYNRTSRFVERLFPRPLEYKKNVIETVAKHEDYDWQAWLSQEMEMDPIHRFNSRVYNDVYDWFNPDKKYPNFENPLFVNLTGNHDIGYSGDATWQHMARFHLLFGQNNYVINYNKGTPEEWRMVVLDSLTLEGPALQEEFLRFTWSFLENLQLQENSNFKGPTVLLTHIPFFKREGLCADGPEHKYYVDNKKEPYKNGKLRSQNHLSYETTQKVLNIVFPNSDQNGIIMTGHDHVGCDDWYNHIDGEWVASKEKLVTDKNPIREVVVRAMMGDYEGQTGIMTGHFDQNEQKWNFEFTYCSFLVQHIWWASKILMLITIFLQSISVLF
jgi:hypothetical protein